MKKVYILAALTLYCELSLAQIRDFQTTRLNSTAGAGVASVLSIEAAVLNPATATFFNDSTVSYQSTSAALRDESDLRETNSNAFPNSNTSQGLFLADHSGPVKGGAAYLNQHENRFRRESYILHGSVPMSASSAMGVSYNYIQDKRPASFSNRHKVFHQLSIGTVHILDEDTIVGLVLNDPTRTNEGDERITGGFQYSVASRFVLIADAGYRYTKVLNEDYLWRAAVQLNIFSDFFFRIGRFYDNIDYFKGSGWGVSWIGPKLGVEFGQKFSEAIAKNSYIYEGETIVDTSVSAMIKF